MENALLVVADIGQDKKGWSAEDSMDELSSLAAAGGTSVKDKIICRRLRPSPAHFLGKGKAEEIAAVCQKDGIDIVIFNNDLTGTQQKNLEEMVQVKTIDRTQLILDIFARRARSNEGKVQVELAQLSYLLPRLIGTGIYLSRLGGGIGTIGPGEQKLELDRRRIKRRIAKLREDLAQISRQRRMRRRSREKHSLTSVAIIGYTNAGKSTLINALTSSNVITEDKLFSTLDPTIRRYKLPNNQKVLFIDTVGFIHDLPYHLIESFKATLEEVLDADILLHVLDASSVKMKEKNDDVHRVLDELNARDKPVITVLNKIDLIADADRVNFLKKNFKDTVLISALKGEGFSELAGKIMSRLSDLMVSIKITLAHTDTHIINLIHKYGKVVKADYKEDKVYLEALVPLVLKEQLEKTAE